MRLSERVEDLLAEWLPHQRWFAGKGRNVDDVSVLADTELVAGDPALHHVVVAVHQEDKEDRYQVLIGLRRELPARLEYAAIGQSNGRHIYDAVHDPDLTRVLLSHMANGDDIGPLAFRSIPAATIDTDLDSLASPAEQSNTSMIYGDSYICKLFRRITPGVNPDLEVSIGLARVGCRHIPALYGWIEMPIAGEPATLAILSEFLRTGTDAWQLAATSVRDLYAEGDLHPDEVGGDFAGESQRLGAATAEVHRDLAVAFGIEERSTDDIDSLAEQMCSRLSETCAFVPELAPYADRLCVAFDDLAKLDEPHVVQRIHGDYHLGQVMRTDAGWAVLDFEGEPVRPLAERREPAHPLRDVAGMLRSFEYAARHLLGGHPNEGQLEFRAREWADRNREAFCRGYAEAGGVDPNAHKTLLRAFEFDKAVYEVMYEARNRPSWLHIPLGSIARLVSS